MALAMLVLAPVLGLVRLDLMDRFGSLLLSSEGLWWPILYIIYAKDYGGQCKSCNDREKYVDYGVSERSPVHRGSWGMRVLTIDSLI